MQPWELGLEEPPAVLLSEVLRVSPSQLAPPFGGSELPAAGPVAETPGKLLTLLNPPRVMGIDTSRVIVSGTKEEVGYHGAKVVAIRPVTPELPFGKVLHTVLLQDRAKLRMGPPLRFRVSLSLLDGLVRAFPQLLATWGPLSEVVRTHHGVVAT